MSSPDVMINALVLDPVRTRWSIYDDYSNNIHFSRPLGTPVVVTYSFSESLQPYFSASAFPGFRSLSAAERDSVRGAATLWDRASGLVLLEVPAGQGDLQIGVYNFPGNGTTGTAYYPGPQFGGDIWFNASNATTPGASAVTLELALHEAGHALGLKHPFDSGTTGVTLPRDEDKRSNTVMTYNMDPTSINRLGPYDVAAIQYLYGADVPAAALYPAGYTPESYLAANTDLLRAFGTSLDAANLHYLTAGLREGRSTSFDALRYLASNPDLVVAFGVNATAATQHYVYAGASEGRSTTGFNPLAYLASYTDLQGALGTDIQRAELHYLTSGRSEGRQITFNAFQYLAANMDVLIANALETNMVLLQDKAALHYLNNGHAEGRRTQGFDAATYLSLNSDVAGTVGNNASLAVQHYIQYGWREGRRTIAIPPVTGVSTTVATAFSAGDLQGGDAAAFTDNWSGLPSAFPSAANASDPVLLSGRDYGQSTGAEVSYAGAPSMCQLSRLGADPVGASLAFGGLAVS